MRVLLDAAHPADVWVWGALEDCLLGDGHETLWVSRPGKEHVVGLIEARGRPQVHGPPAGAGRLGLARELVLRDVCVWRAVRSFGSDVICTRSPSGVHAGRLTRTPVLYDNDDGSAAGLLYWAAAPFADLVTGPAAGISFGRGPKEPAPSTGRSRLGMPRRRHSRRRGYRGYKELLYLHPSRFEPDPLIRSEIGAEPGERLFLVRLSAFAALHDLRERGLRRPVIDAIVQRLGGRGRVLVSTEAEPPGSLARLTAPVAPHRFHHLLAACDLVVGDSQTVAVEAAMLGVPSFRFSSWAGRHRYMNEIEQRWRLSVSFQTDDEAGLLAALDDALADLDASAELQQQRRRAMLEWCDDPVEQMRDWVSLVHRRSIDYASVR